MAIRIRSWAGGRLIETADVDQLGRLVAAEDGRTWIDLTNPAPDLVRAVGRRLGLHPLVVDDISERNERAKVELVGDVIHVVSFVLEREADVEAHEVDFVLGRDFLLSVHPARWDPMSAHQLKGGVGPLLEHGADHMLWALADAIVDGYFPVFDALEDEIDAIQDRVVGQPDNATLQQIFHLRRELIRMRHIVAPSREVFAQLTSREYGLIGEANVYFFRDVYDHLIRLSEELDVLRELVAGAIEIYLSTVNNNLSTIMKRLTGVTVVIAGIGAVAGIFGMSEAATALAGSEGSGFYVVVALTVLASIAGVLVLRRIDWL
ncbi:MAG TPA: magnesium transporter CorA family protein [Candidatus Limnocylindrales bacterium]|nr:magnesium transporter CorA family protein [Candidatus Limnocylindrales bacterium]